MYNKKSSKESQMQIRTYIVNALKNDPTLVQKFFAVPIQGRTNELMIDRATLDQFIESISTSSERVPDYNPNLIAEILKVNIIILQTGGNCVRGTAPGCTRTIYLHYTGAHYNSYTITPL